MHSSSSDPSSDDRRTKRRQLELQLFSLEADRSRFEREQESMGISLMSLRRSLHQIETQIQEQEQNLEKITGKILTIDAEIQKAKKSIRLL